MRNYKFRLYPNRVVEAELNRDYNATRNMPIRALDGREPASMLSEPESIPLGKQKQVQTLKQEAPCGSLG